MVGRIRAGEPTVAIEEINSHIALIHLFSRKIHSPEVVGRCMRDAGILNGDFVIVKPQSTVVHGEMALSSLAMKLQSKSSSKMN